MFDRGCPQGCYLAIRVSIFDFSINIWYNIYRKLREEITEHSVIEI